jgi:hypothetical protein
MNIRILVILFLAYALPALGAEKLKAFASVDLDAIATDAGTCPVKWRTSTNRLLWIDQSHLAVQRFQYCSSQEPKSRKSSMEVVLIETNGHLDSIRRDEMFGPLRGPNGTLLIGHGSQVDLFGLDLRSRQSLRCPIAEKLCTVYVPTQFDTDSDFALCSQSANVENCSFYRGFPAEEIPQHALSIAITNGIPHTPYEKIPYPGTAKISPQDRSTWKVSSSETWYFDSNNVLTSLGSNGSTGPVVTEAWTPEGSNCTGELSTSEPHRFLATCIGAHFYTDGDLDGIFGYSRIALFDVPSRRILARIDGRAYTWAALSPVGNLIAVLHGDRVNFYRVN